MKLPKKEYPRGFAPIHEVKNWSKVRSIIRKAKKEKIPLFLVSGTEDNGSLMTGTHRLMAKNIMDMLGIDSSNIDYELLENREDKDKILEIFELEDFEGIDYYLDNNQLENYNLNEDLLN